MLVQCAPHRLRTARQKQHPPQHLGDPFHPQLRVLLLQRHHLGFDGRRHLRFPDFAPTDQWLQPGLSLFTVAPNPSREHALADAGLPRNQLQGVTFLQPQLDQLPPQFERIGLAAAPRCPPRGAGSLLLLF